MKTLKIPQADSIEELAQFWDTHDLTDFEDQLEEVVEPVFVPDKDGSIKINLQSDEIEAIKRIAKSKGIGSEDLIKEWIIEKLQPHLKKV